MTALLCEPIQTHNGTSMPSGGGYSISPIEYIQMVFTLPAQIARIAYRNKRALYGLLFRTSAETVVTIAADSTSRILLDDRMASFYHRSDVKKVRDQCLSWILALQFSMRNWPFEGPDGRSIFD